MWQNDTAHSIVGLCIIINYKQKHRLSTWNELHYDGSQKWVCVFFHMNLFFLFRKYASPFFNPSRAHKYMYKLRFIISLLWNFINCCECVVLNVIWWNVIFICTAWNLGCIVSLGDFLFLAGTTASYCKDRTVDWLM